MKVNYEEKTFEQYFNIELSSKKNNLLFPPGQFQEGFLGFDAAFFINDLKANFPFLRYYFRYPYRGEELKFIAKEIEEGFDKYIESLPKFKVNLLLQYKKPEYEISKRSRFYKFWQSPCYRYSIYLKQHNTLMKIYKKFNKKILILYASPAIRDAYDLFKKYRDKKIVDNCNFTEASSIKKHKHITYVAGKDKSVGFSIPEEINTFNILSQEMKDYNFEAENNKTFLTQFSKNLEISILDNEDLKEAYRLYSEDYSWINDYPILSSFFKAHLSKLLTGLQWGVMS